MGWCIWYLELFLICIYKGKRDGVVDIYLEKVEKMFDILVWSLFFYEFFLIVESMNIVLII